MVFHPAGAVVPEERQTRRLLLRPLLATHVELDYEAVMSSAAELRAWSQSDWPADDFALEQNLDELRRHEREHRERQAFTYTVLDPAGAVCLGCVYITPLRSETQALFDVVGHAAQVGFWVRTSELARDLDRHLLGVLLEWLATDWAFDAVAFAISRRDQRQATLLSETGLEPRVALTLADGRSCWAFRWVRSRARR